MTAIAITGYRVLSPLGEGGTPLWEACLSERSAIQPDGLGRIPGLEPSARHAQLARLARECIREAGWGSLSSDDGLILATTGGEAYDWEARLARGDYAAALKRQPLGCATESLREGLSFRGRSLLVASACSASTQALALGAESIRAGRVKRCLVGGFEFLADLMTSGFRSLQLLSPAPCLPFDRNRAGINLSEAIGFYALEAAGPGVRGHARILGAGLSTDAHHLTAPEPQGAGLRAAVEQALRRAGLSPAGISWVHAHGTGSQANDLSEGRALREVFGPDHPPVASTKHVHGHALGACGALELALVLESLARGQIPPSAGLREPDPEIPLRFSRGPARAEVTSVLKTTLGFGGNNAALVIGNAKGTRA